MKKEQIDKDLIISLTNEMKLAGVPAFPFSAEYKELYSSLFLCLNLPLLIAEPRTGRILDANYAAGTMFNCANDALRLTTINNLFTESDLDSLFRELQKSKCISAKLTLKHKLISISCAETFSGYINIKGKKALFICIENFNKESGFVNNIHKAGADNSDAKDALVLTDLSGNILKINEVFRLLMEYDESEVIGKPVQSFLPGLSIPLSTNTSTYPLLLKAQRKNGSSLYVEAGPDNRPEVINRSENYIFYVREILPEDIIQNEILWLSEMLEVSDGTNILTHLNRYKSFISQGSYLLQKNGDHPVNFDFNKMISSSGAGDNKEDIKIKSISHEFRTLMNIIMGFSEILRTELQNNDHVEMVNYIADSSMKVMSISSVVVKLLQEYTKQNKPLNQ